MKFMPVIHQKWLLIKKKCEFSIYWIFRKTSSFKLLSLIVESKYFEFKSCAPFLNFFVVGFYYIKKILKSKIFQLNGRQRKHVGLQRKFVDIYKP